MQKDYSEIYLNDKNLWGDDASISAKYFAQYLIDNNINNVHLIATGYGRNIRPFYESNLQIVASDIAQSGIDLIYEKYPDVNALELDMLNPQSIVKNDAIYSFSLLHLFDDLRTREKIIENIAKMLNNNGILFLVNMDIGNIFRDKNKKINIITKEEVVSYCVKYNLDFILEKNLMILSIIKMEVKHIIVKGIY